MCSSHARIQFPTAINLTVLNNANFNNYPHFIDLHNSFRFQIIIFNTENLLNISSVWWVDDPALSLSFSPLSPSHSIQFAYAFRTHYIVCSNGSYWIGGKHTADVWIHVKCLVFSLNHASPCSFHLISDGTLRVWDARLTVRWTSH